MSGNELILGPALVGAWFNTAFLTLEWTQAGQYFMNWSSRDHVGIKAAVIATLLFDLVGSIAVFGAMYELCVTRWGDPSVFAVQDWPYPILHTFGGFTQLVVQHFFIYRFWSLSKNFLITGFLEAGALLSWAGSLMTAITIWKFPTLEGRSHLILSCSIWFSAAAAVDVAISAGLIWRYHLIQGHFYQTRSLIRRLTTKTVSTGSLTSIWAILVLVMFLVFQQTNLPAFFAFTIARVYTNSMLYSLNDLRTRTGTLILTPADVQRSDAKKPKASDLAAAASIRGDGVQLQNVAHVDEDRDSLGDHKSPV